MFLLIEKTERRIRARDRLKSVQPHAGCHEGGMSIFGRVERSQVVVATVASDLRLPSPFSFCLGYSGIFPCVSANELGVLLVLGIAGEPQVCDPVIHPIAIDMIDLLIWPNAEDI